MPDMTIVPEKYHVFISPPLRRVFLGDADDSNREAMIEKLNTENAALKARVSALRRDKDLLMDRCEAAQCTLARLTSDERAARLARDKAREEARLAKLDLEKLRFEHDRLVIRSR
jgi:predicted RNase H-like nuclease (RuvC/YqgF family)